MSDLKDLIGFDPDELEELHDLPTESAERIRREWKDKMEKLTDGITDLLGRMETLEQRFEDLREEALRPVVNNITVPQAPPAPVNVTVPTPKVDVNVEAAKVTIPQQKPPQVTVDVPAAKSSNKKLRTWRDSDGNLNATIEDVKE